MNDKSDIDVYCLPRNFVHFMYIRVYGHFHFVDDKVNLFTCKHDVATWRDLVWDENLVDK